MWGTEIRRKWRRTRCCSDLLTFKLKKKYAIDLINRSRCQFYKSFISKISSDQKRLVFATKKLLNHTDEVPYPPFNDKLKFTDIIEKTVNIQVKPDNMASGLSARPSSSNNCPHPFTIMDWFLQLSENDVVKLIDRCAKNTCKLDPNANTVSR